MNPVITRELINQLRTPRTFLHLFLLLFLSMIAFCVFYMYAASQWVYGQMDGRTLFYSIVCMAYLLVIPVMTMAASSIAREREENTLEMLLAAPMKSIRILWGKCIAPILYALLVLTSLVPFLGLCFLMGGLSPEEMLQCCAVIIGLYCFVMMIGVTVSLFSKSSGNAARISILLLIAFLLGPLATRFILLIYFQGLLNTPIPTLGMEVYINPFWALWEIYSPNSSLPFPVYSLNSYFLFSLLTPLQNQPGVLTGTILLIFTIILFFLTAFIYSKIAPFLTSDFAWSQVLFKRKEENSNEQSGRKSTEIRPFFGHRFWAITQKEILEQNRKWLSRDWTLFFSCGALSILVAWLMFDTTEVKDLTHHITYMILAVFGVGLTCLFSPISPSYTMLHERRRDTWPLLRVTTLPSLDIVIGKVSGTFRQAAIPIVSIFLFFYGASSFFFRINGVVPAESYFLQITSLCVFLLICTLFYTCIGIYYSSASRRFKASPHRKTFMLVIFHVTFPFILYGITSVISWLLFYTRPLYGRSPSSGKWFNDVFEILNQFLLPFSPLTYMAIKEWNFSTYFITVIHASILLGLSVFFVSLAGMQIKRRE